MRRMMERTVVAAMSSMRVKPEISRKGRKAPTRAPTGSGQVRGADAGRKGRLVIGDWGTDCSRPAFSGRAYARKAPTPVGVETRSRAQRKRRKWESGPTTLLTCFAEELRRAPATGDFEFWIEKEMLTSRIPGPDAGRGRDALSRGFLILD